MKYPLHFRLQITETWNRIISLLVVKTKANIFKLYQPSLSECLSTIHVTYCLLTDQTEYTLIIVKCHLSFHACK